VRLQLESKVDVGVRRPVADQTPLSQELLAYLRVSSLREDALLRQLRAETANYPMGRAMQVMAEEGQFLSFLVKLTNTRIVLEIGTFTGYSALSMAKALPPDGRLITCDITHRWLPIAERYWQRAGVADRIEARIGDATQTLTNLLEEEGQGFVDFAFIDADKVNYRAYYEQTLQLMRPGGLMAIDNTFYFGRVVDAEDNSPDTTEIRLLNSSLLTDDRIDLSMLPMADGITLVRKRNM
jgi:O-methyltransferase